MNKIILLFCLILTSQNLYAVQEIIKTYRGVRSLGMGGTFVTTGLYDDALFGNPATQLEDPTWKVSLLNVTAEINSNLVKDLQKFQEVTKAQGSEVFTKATDGGLIGRNEHVRVSMLPSFYAPRLFGDNVGFAFGLLANLQANIMIRSDASAIAQAYADAGPAFGFAMKFLDDTLTVGINTRVLYRLAADQNISAVQFLAGKKLSLTSIGGQGIGVDGDVGGYYKLPLALPFFLRQISVGGSVNNVVATKFNVIQKKLIQKLESLPPQNYRSYGVGARVDFPDVFILRDTHWAVEMLDIGYLGNKTHSAWKRFHMGGETRLIKFLLVRAGFNQGYPGGGLGVDIPILKIDVATYGEELGTNIGQLQDRRYVARISFDI